MSKLLLDLEATVTENQSQTPTEGGRLLLTVDPEQLRQGKRWVQIQLVANALTNEALDAFPYTRSGIDTRRFRITVSEITPRPGAAKKRTAKK